MAQNKLKDQTSHLELDEDVAELKCVEIDDIKYSLMKIHNEND